MARSDLRAKDAAKPASRSKTGRYTDRIEAIQAQRERQMAEIRLLTKLPNAGTFARKAETLLTVGWGRASWEAREEILRTVNWLLEIERGRDVS